MIELLEHLEEFEAGLAPKICERVGAEVFESIRGALPTDWIEASKTRAIIDALVAELGERAPQLWSSLVSKRLFETPLLGGFFDMLVRLGGLNPARFLKALPRGWDNAYKGWGTLRVVPLEARCSRIEFANVPPYLFEHRQHWLAIRGVLVGLVAAADETGEAELRYFPDESRVEAEVRW